MAVSVCEWAGMGICSVLSLYSQCSDHFVDAFGSFFFFKLLWRLNWIDARPCCVERCGVIMYSDSFQKLCRQSATLRSHWVQALLLHTWNTTNGCKQTSWPQSYCSTRVLLFRITLIIQIKEKPRNVRVQMNIQPTSLKYPQLQTCLV